MPWHYFKIIPPMSSWAPFNANHKCPFHSDSTSTKIRNSSHYGRKYNCIISKWKGPGVHMLPESPSLFAYWINAFPLTLVVWVESMYIYRHLFWFSLIISKPIWMESFSLHLSPLGWSSDILPSFDRLVNGGWALLPGPSRYSRRFCYVSFETTVPSISWLLV